MQIYPVLEKVHKQLAPPLWPNLLMFARSIYIRSIVASEKEVLTACAFLPKAIFYFRELRKVRRTGAISRSHVCCCRYESSLNHFIFIPYRMSLRMAIRATQEEAGERVTM